MHFSTQVQDEFFVVPATQQQWMPATFRERGCAVPFTSPMLAGARVRLLERRCDLIVPHPGGARGVYIFALASLTEFCAPTLHDISLAQRLQGLSTVCPSSVRSAARVVAMAGTAGRDASAAAHAADEADCVRRVALEAGLLTLVLGEGGAAGAEPAQRARRAMLMLASRTERTPEAVKADVERLAAALIGAGLDLPSGTAGSEVPGRCRAVLADMEGVVAQIRAWLTAGGDRSDGLLVMDAAALVVAAARYLLNDAHALLADPPALLSAWAGEPHQVTSLVGRPGWLLDGWAHLCQIWYLADDGHARADALAEIASILPPIPSEAESWLACAPALAAGVRERALLGPVRRTGRLVQSESLSVVARNEHIRALTA